MGQSKEDIIKSAKGFEFYVSNVWPIHRKLVGSKLAKRCVKCAASEHMIALDSDQICKACKNIKASQNDTDFDTSEDLEAFNTILDEAQCTGSGQYDALIPYSGGKDSSYLIRRIQKEFPQLRILAFSMDNGFMSPIAKENIDNLLPKLNVDHLFVRPAKDFYSKLFSYGITHLNEEGGYGTVDFSDGEFILDTARNIAAEKKIPLILCGYSKYQVINGLKFKSFEYPRELEANDRTHVAGMPLCEFHDKNEIKLWWHPSQYNENERPRLLFPLYCWDLEEEDIIQAVQEMGLMQEKAVSPIVTNHLFIPVLGVVDVHKFGYTSYEYEFCRMIRDGKADLVHWRNTFEFLEYTSQSGLFVEKICVDMLARINLTLKDVGIKFS
jgi:hypothetical protein